MALAIDALNPAKKQITGLQHSLNLTDVEFLRLPQLGVCGVAVSSQSWLRGSEWKSENVLADYFQSSCTAASENRL